MDPESRIKELGLELPPSVPPGGVYKSIVVTGNIGYISGHGPYLGDDKYITGRVGDDLSLEDGKKAARQVGLALLRTMKDNLDDLSRINRIIKTLALVNSTDDFCQQPQVINGFSELMGEVFGEADGIGARSALAANTLPGNIAVEIELIIEIKE